MKTPFPFLVTKKKKPTTWLSHFRFLKHHHTSYFANLSERPANFGRYYMFWATGLQDLTMLILKSHEETEILQIPSSKGVSNRTPNVPLGNDSLHSYMNLLKNPQHPKLSAPWHPPQFEWHPNCAPESQKSEQLLLTIQFHIWFGLQCTYSALKETVDFNLLLNKAKER